MIRQSSLKRVDDSAVDSLRSELRTALLTLLALAGLLAPLVAEAGDALRGTGDLAIVIERAGGTVQIVDTSGNQSLGRVDGPRRSVARLGGVSRATARYAFVFGRDGGLSKVDLLTASLVARIVQAGNSIGGAISQDGRLVAVSNYEPGGVKVFDADDAGAGRRHPGRVRAGPAVQGDRPGRCARPALRVQPVGCRRDLDRRLRASRATPRDRAASRTSASTPTTR